jgi:hypothetical protein
MVPDSRGLATPDENDYRGDAMKDKEIDPAFDRARALRFLHQPRPCRVCGMVFRPERVDALTCSSTCRSRRKRGWDLAYVAGLGKAAREDQVRLHENVAELISELMRSFAALRQRRRESRAAKDDYRAVLKHFESEVIARLAAMGAAPPAMIPTADKIMEAIHQVIPNCPEKFATQLKLIVLDTLLDTLRSSKSSSIITVKDK